MYLRAKWACISDSREGGKPIRQMAHRQKHALSATVIKAGPEAGPHCVYAVCVHEKYLETRS